MYIGLCIIKCVYECMRVCEELCVTMERSVSQETLQVSFNPLTADLNPICHLLALLGTHHILHFSGLRVNRYSVRCVHVVPFLDSILCLLIQFKASHNVI
jgi:hypothetical protein